MNSGKRAVIIGANSYIARNLIKVNELEGYADVSLYDCQSKHLDAVDGYQQIDFTNQSALEQAIVNSDLIYFFTGKTGTMSGFDAPEIFSDVNERCLFSLLRAYRSTHCQAKIVFPSTRLVYRGNEIPVSEEAPKEFRTPYAIQKYACEQYLAMYSRMFEVKYCVLRICVPYGTLVTPVSSYGTLDAFLHQAQEQGTVSIYGEGNQRRTFTYIEDLCRTLWLAGLDKSCVDDVFNVGGEDCSIAHVAEIVAHATSSYIIKQPWGEDALKLESGSTVFDSRKLDALIGVQSTVTIKQWAEAHLYMEDQNMRETQMRKSAGGGVRSIVLLHPNLLGMLLERRGDRL